MLGRTINSKRLVAAAVAASLIASACGSAQNAESATEANTPTKTAADPTADVLTETRPELLRLTLPTFGGGTFDPNSVAGENVLLWFWGAH